MAYKSESYKEPVVGHRVLVGSATVRLANLSWSQGSGGKYYCDNALSTGKSLIAITFGDWSNLTATMNVLPYISATPGRVGLMSNTNTFGNASVGIKYVYYAD